MISGDHSFKSDEMLEEPSHSPSTQPPNPGPISSPLQPNEVPHHSPFYSGQSPLNSGSSTPYHHSHMSPNLRQDPSKSPEMQKFPGNPMESSILAEAGSKDVSRSPFASKETNQPSVFEDQEEEEHFKEILAAFFNYKNDALQDLQRMQRNFERIPERDRALLDISLKDRIMRLVEAIDKNYKLLFACVFEHAEEVGIKKNPRGLLMMTPLPVPFKQVSKMRSTLRQFYREWSSDGERERNEAFEPLLDAAKKHFPITEETRNKIRVLCPGSGLGRLPLEFVRLGYCSQGNEFSYFMLLTSDFILNTVQKPDAFSIHPFIHNLCNKFNYEDALIECKIPDICPSSYIPSGADFSMVAGEFVECYVKQKEEWDMVATCFFIDTAHNIIEYIRTIYAILKPGGIWANIGPLLYHYAEMYEELSLELSWEEVRAIILKIGFEIIEEGEKKTTYCSEKRSMLTMEYNAVYFTARKPK